MSQLNLSGLSSQRDSTVKHSRKNSAARRSTFSKQAGDTERPPQVEMQHLAPYHALKDVDLKDSWSIGPLSKFTYDERQTLGQAVKKEI